ncbi:MAG: S-layer homology domain-containing protein, partial [Firmicutes bacterium]|nr:S-layer homology domain-containing protein [Bacillota bacterium]
MKNLMVLDGKAWLISNGNVITYDLASEKTETVFGNDIREFIVVSGGFLYTKNGDAALYFHGENGADTKIAADVMSFDCSADTVYYSNGADGIYSCAFDGSGKTCVADGGAGIVFADDLFWQAEGGFYSLNGGKEATVLNEEGASVTVLGDEVLVTEEEILAMGENDVYGVPSGSDGGVSPLAAGVSALPDGEYKNWKQGDSRWGGNALGNSTIARQGCATVAVSILLVGSGAEKDRYLKGLFDPGVFVKEMTANGGFTSGGAMYWYKVSSVYPKFGSSLRDTGKGTGGDFYNLSPSGQATALKNHMAQGKFILICVNNSKTGNTHWLAVDYATTSGIFICDPGYNSVASPTDVFSISWYPKVTRAIIFNYTGERWTEGGDPDPAPPEQEYQWENPFGDVKKAAWYYNNVGEVYEAGWMVGRSNTVFAPDERMTRAEFVCMASRLADTDFSAYDEVEFTDINYDSTDAWYSRYIPWAVANGIMVGHLNPDGSLSFRPQDPVTREQICAVLVRLAPRVDVDLSAVESPVTFADQSKISPWAKDTLKTAQLAGLIYGEPNYNTGKLYVKPQGYATRAEVAAIFLRFTRKIPII